MHVKVKKLASNAVIPTKQRSGDAGFDLYTSRIENCGSYIKVYSGVAIQPPPGYYFDLACRSSIYKKNLRLANSLGIIDTTYRGELIGIFDKIEGISKHTFEEGERFAQIILRKMHECEIVEVEELDESVRNKSGFGSSGA